MPVSMFATMDGAKSEAASRGLDIIDLSIGSSDLSPPPEVLVAVREAITDPSTYGYCLHACTRELREAAANWYAGRYRYPVDPGTNVLALIGAQEGFANLLLAITDPGTRFCCPILPTPPTLGWWQLPV